MLLVVVGKALVTSALLLVLMVKYLMGQLRIKSIEMVGMLVCFFYSIHVLREHVLLADMLLLLV